ncbi:hypothetical protein H4S02_003555 [Coemansia sp. RSA 2611]|nr:hypothetical protein H4S01_003366 [Coemansia sp. RSA 2610]KAJ2387055.1 hypothetical protein H4S02_003555 [Coemansia sp. RSA 2611]
MSFNRFRFYDKLQRSATTLLFGTTVVGAVFITANVYTNWVEKQRLQSEVSTQRWQAVRTLYGP